MSEPQLSLTADADFDDLPRTVRRERDARAREAREREARERDGTLTAPPPRYGREDPYASRIPSEDPVPAVVKRFDVPFMRLVFFFIKAVLAAIPALILLGGLLWFAGHILQTNFPELIKMKILITFPNG